MNNELLKIVIV